MADLIDLRKLHIQDSSELRKRGLMVGTIKLIEDDIRALGTGSHGEALLAVKGGVIYALIKLFRPDRKNCRAHIEFVFTSDANADTHPKRTPMMICFVIYGNFLKTEYLSAKYTPSTRIQFINRRFL